jgi:hypothetical protein
LDFKDDHQDTEIVRDNFATLAGSIVCESEKLITLGDEVATACTRETLKNVMMTGSSRYTSSDCTHSTIVGSTARESSEN